MHSGVGKEGTEKIEVVLAVGFEVCLHIHNILAAKTYCIYR
jgi:hypothetical protein